MVWVTTVPTQRHSSATNTRGRDLRDPARGSAEIGPNLGRNRAESIDLPIKWRFSMEKSKKFLRTFDREIRL